MQVASYTGVENANLHIHLEYAANIDASNETIGRKSTLPVHLRFLPSLEVPVPPQTSTVRLYQTDCVVITVKYNWPSAQGMFLLQVTAVAFHEHHLLADVRGHAMRAPGPHEPASLILPWCP